MKHLYSRFLVLVVVLSSIPFLLNAQTFKLTGIIRDKQNQSPVIGAIVLLKEAKDTTKQYSALTNVNGYFSIDGLRNQSYKLSVQNLGYEKVASVISIKNQNLNLGNIVLEPKSQLLNEVVVMGQGPAAVQKGDTTEMSSSAYKTNPDANAEDLVTKMPGITIENGTVKAQGEEVKKVYVDGKQFFGDDPSVALKNLPADVIDKVQIFNKLSDQAELTGVDDGNSTKTINIITRQNRRSGQFGKIAIGSDLNDKYIVAGNLNIFKGTRRITLIGTTNNINQQNFSMQDLLGSTGGNRGGRGGGGGGGQSGITKTNSIGLNFTDTWAKKINVNGSYFFNTTDNNLEQESIVQNFILGESANSTVRDSSHTISKSGTKNNNHRFNMRFEYAIDSANSILFTPRLTLQSNTANRFSIYNIEGNGLKSSTQNTSITNADGYNLSGDLVLRHKFKKPRRTISVGLSSSVNNKDSKNTQLAIVDTIPDNQLTEGYTKGSTVSSNVSYTEPVGKYSMLMLNYTTSFTKNKTDKETYPMGDLMEKGTRYDSLSNIYDNTYFTNRGGLSLAIRKDKLNFRTGVDYQRAQLDGNQQFPAKGSVNKTFDNFLPSMMLLYKFSKTNNIRVFYRTTTDAPSISQLQNVVDNSDRLLLSTGNPNLRQAYSHNLSANFSFANPDKGTNAFFVLSGGYTTDIIGERTIFARRDTLHLPQYNVSLLPNGQLSIPVNLDYSMNLRSLINMGIYVKPLKSNINMLAGLNYSQSPGYIDSVLNRSNNYTITNSLIFSSNVSEKIDFSLSYTSNYSIVKNSVEVQGTSDNKYWYQSASAKVNWIFFKGFVLQSDVNAQVNRGLVNSMNENYIVWNAGFGKKFLKNNAAELKLSVFDILQQNKNSNTSVSASKYTYTRTNTCPRYFMLVFTYNLKNFNGQKEPEQRREYREGGGGRSGDGPGMYPMGTPPAGGGDGPAMGPPPS